MKKFQVWGWLISGFLKKHKKIILFSTSLGVIIAIFLIWVLPYIPRPNPKEKIAIIGQFTLSNLPEEVANKIGQGLVMIMEDGTPVGALAEDWSLSSDKLTYTFFLRDNLYWQDEKKLSAKDLSFDFPDTETKILDDKTIQFKLKEPFSPFPTLLAKPVFKNGIIGTGEYKVRKYTDKLGFIDTITLESSKKTLNINFYSNLDQAKTAFLLGKVDKIESLYIDPFANNPEWENYLIKKQKIDYNQYLALFLNNKDPLLQSKNFRQALAYATQKPTDSTRTLGPISSNSWAYNKDLKPYEYDPKHAREILEKDLGDLNKAQDIKITISTTQSFLNLAEKIKLNWEETLTINVDIQVINTIPQDFQVLLASEKIPLDPDQYTLWHSTQIQNITGFSNPRIDKLLEDGRQEHDKEKREEIYNNFQKFFVEESPIIFLQYPETYNIERKSIIKPLIAKFLTSNSSSAL